MGQTLAREQQPDSPASAARGKAVVVGVDGSECSNAATEWALAQARASHRPLTLLHVLDETEVASRSHESQSDAQQGWRLLTDAESRLGLRGTALDVRKEMAVGTVDSCLVSRSADQSTLVVGRRGRGSFARLLVGSSSLSVASHASVPVVVVPAGWVVEAHEAEPVVVGVDNRDLQEEALTFAFAEAQRRGVPLVVAHGQELREPGRETSAVADRDSLAGLARAVEPFRSAYPDVVVSFIDRPGHPLTVLLDDVGPAGMLVLGRHSSRRRGGFPFGSVARGVLHHAEVPVAIVPLLR